MRNIVRLEEMSSGKRRGANWTRRLIRVNPDADFVGGFLWVCLLESNLFEHLSFHRCNHHTILDWHCWEDLLFMVCCWSLIGIFGKILCGCVVGASFAEYHPAAEVSDRPIDRIQSWIATLV